MCACGEAAAFGLCQTPLTGSLWMVLYAMPVRQCSFVVFLARVGHLVVCSWCPESTHRGTSAVVTLHMLLLPSWSLACFDQKLSHHDRLFNGCSTCVVPAACITWTVMVKDRPTMNSSSRPLPLTSWLRQPVTTYTTLCLITTATVHTASKVSPYTFCNIWQWT